MNYNTNKCSECHQKERCGRVFETLGKAEGPNVTWKVLVAFLLPIIVFILSLAGANKLLESRFEGKGLIAATFLAAFVVTTTVVLLIWAIRHSTKR